jgi:YVTN family beta-propeller protein
MRPTAADLWRYHSLGAKAQVRRNDVVVSRGILAMLVGVIVGGAAPAAHAASAADASARSTSIPPSVAPVTQTPQRPAVRSTANAASAENAAGVSPAGTTVGVGSLPSAVAVTNTHAYITNSDGNSVSVVSLGTAPSVVATIPVGRLPSGAALSPDSSTLYVTNFSDGTLSIIDASTNAVTHTVTVGKDPTGVVQIGSRVYVANLLSGTVSVVNPSSGAVTATIPLTGSKAPAPSGLAAAGDASKLYVDDAQNGTMDVVDLSSAPGRQVTSTRVGTWPAYLSVAGGTAFVANATRGGSTPGTVSELDLTTSPPTVSHTIPVGAHPYGVAAVPSLGEVLATNSADGTVTVLDAASGTALTTFAVGRAPDAIAVTPDASTAVVSNEADDTISIFPVTGWRDLWDQLSGGVAGNTNSQNYESTYSAFDDFAADDFQVSVTSPATAWRLGQVVVDGAYGDSTGPGPGPASSFNVFIYANDATTSLPGSLVYSDQDIAQIPQDSTGDVTLPLSPEPDLAPGHYWVSVQANQPFTTNGAWFWDDRAPQNLNGAVWEQPGNRSGLGCTSWAPRTGCLTLSSSSDPDQSFALIGGTVTGGGATIAPTGRAAASIAARGPAAATIVAVGAAGATPSRAPRRSRATRHRAASGARGCRSRAGRSQPTTRARGCVRRRRSSLIGIGRASRKPWARSHPHPRSSSRTSSVSTPSPTTRSSRLWPRSTIERTIAAWAEFSSMSATKLRSTLSSVIGSADR